MSVLTTKSKSCHELFAMNKCVSRVIVVFLLVLLSTATRAAEIPNLNVRVDLNVREQEFVDFIDALFRKISVPVIVNENIEGTVNGRFDGTAKEVLNEISTAFNVIVYYDGAVTYVYNANELNRRVIITSNANATKVKALAVGMLLPDSRNNIKVETTGLQVTGTPRFVEQIENLVASVETARDLPKVMNAPEVVVNRSSDPSPAIYRVFKLKHAWANDTTFQVGNQSLTVPGVASILKKLISIEPVAYDSKENTSFDRRGSLNGLRGQGLNSIDSSEIGESTDELVVSRSGRNEVIRIVADSRLNAVIVRDTADRIPAYEALITSLDVESRMVEIEATIIDINTDISRELGVNWRYSIDDGEALFGQGNESDQQLLPGSSINTLQGRGGILSFMLGESSDFLARIRALEEQGAARIVSKPHVITLSDVEAVLGASTEFFVRIAGDEEVDLFNIPVGTFLRVTPHVFDDETGRRIKLRVNIEDGSRSGAQTVDNIPVIERSNINTQAVINEGDSLLVGGLVRESHSKSDYRVPLLGSIPGVGRLFRSDRTSSTRIERLFLITPRLADGMGFGASEASPALAGRAHDIVTDAGRRLDNVNWPDKSKLEYRSDDVRQNTATAGSETSRASTSYSPFVVPSYRTVQSPFAVEAWPIATR